MAAGSKTETKEETVVGSGRKKGRCKWFNVSKGWGFITPDDGGQDVFVHQSVIQMGGFRSLEENEELEYEVKQCEKGQEATLVVSAGGGDCKGSSRRPLSKNKKRKVRCYNCGEFANHVAAKCSLGTQPKRCHNCKSVDHLVADCPCKPKETPTSKKSPTNQLIDKAIDHLDINGKCLNENNNENQLNSQPVED